MKDIIIYIAIFFAGYILGAARERVLNDKNNP